MSLVIHYWIGDVQDCQGVSASEMTCILSSGALNSTHSLTQRGAEPASGPFGRRTDAVTHGTPDESGILYYVDTIASLSIQTRKTWYSEYSKWLPPVA